MFSKKRYCSVFSLILFFFILNNNGFSQNYQKIEVKLKHITSNTSRIEEFRDESKPGSPILASEVIYIAIPPGSQADIIFAPQNQQTLNNFTPKVNDKVVQISDTLLKYEPVAMSKEYFSGSLYPGKQFEFLGYSWISNYYCAVIKINTQQYDWKNRQLINISESKITLNIKNIKPFTPNSEPVNDFEKDALNILANKNEASQFRSLNPLANFADSTGNWITYNQDYVKLKIPNDGIYRITYNNLIDYGINPATINPKFIKIFSKGFQIPVFIAGENDLTFDPADYIEFWGRKNYSGLNYRNIPAYGEDYPNFMNRYTDTSVVWLTVAQDEGLRASVDTLFTPGVQDSITSHLVKLHFEIDKRLWYYDATVPRTQLPNWQEQKVWTWLTCNQGGTASQSFSVNNVTPNTTGFLNFRLISYAATISNSAHKFALSINNSTTPSDSIVFNYKETINFSKVFSSSLLSASNTVKLWGRPTSSTFHQVLIDWIDIDFYRNNFAATDSLSILIPDSVVSALRSVVIRNVTSPDSLLFIYKVSPGFKKITKYQSTGTTTRTIVFTDTVQGGDRYLFVKKSFHKTPLFEIKKQFANLRNTARGADYLIISNKLLTSSASTYKNFIQTNYNKRVELIYTDDIFDEFSFGLLTAESIKEFLIYANKNWVAPRPAYLLLLGDANYDYKNIVVPAPTPRKRNLVPSFGNPVSDVWYVCWDTLDINIPQMFIGRIPANSDLEVNNYLVKHQKYIQRGFDSWNKFYMFFSGGDVSKPSELEQIRAANEDVFANVIKTAPIGGGGIHFYKTINPPTNFGPYTQQEISNNLNFGSLFVSYLGHSGTQTWDNGINDVTNLKNAHQNRFPLITDFGCSTGKFAEPDVDAFSELFVSQSSNGQAINYLGNASWGYLSTSLRFPRYFYEFLLSDTVTSVGQAHFLGKMKQFTETGVNDVNRVFNYCNLLFGDPIIPFALPRVPNFYVEPSFISIVESNPNDLLDSISVIVKYRNLGRVINDSLDIYIVDNMDDSVMFEYSAKVKIPLNMDSLVIRIPAKGRGGDHILTVELDKNNLISEIYENDNSTELPYSIYAATFKAILSNNYYVPFKETINLLNPAYKIGNSNGIINILVSDKKTFENPVELTTPLDTLITPIRFTNLSEGKRYWWKAKYNAEGLPWSESYSFNYSNFQYDWFVDSLFNSTDITFNETNFNDSTKAFEIVTGNNELRVISAGGYDGAFGSLLYNRVETLPNSFYWGIATAEIDSITLKPYNIKYFINTVSTNGDSLKNYINSLPNGKMLAIIISADGCQTVIGSGPGTPVRQAIKTLGSYYIDSIIYRQSWCILGRKGAPIGSVLESYKKEFQGIAGFDTSVIANNSEGTITFPAITNSSKWKTLTVRDSLFDGTSIQVIPLGIKNDNTVDTLAAVTFIGDSADISYIDAMVYPRIKLSASLTANALRQSPRIYFAGVNYDKLPELAINYQVVQVSKDSVMQGDSVQVSFKVTNAGYIKADSINVTLELVKPDNSTLTLINNTLPQIDSMQAIDISSYYKANFNDGFGNMAFRIKIDSENKITELYESNNTFELPVFVIKDTTSGSVSEKTIAVLFNGKNILDGDFISPEPEIITTLNYPVWFPSYDTTAMEFYLDAKLVNRSDMIIHDDTINREMTFNYKTELEDGEHTLRIFGKNSFGQMEITPGFERTFMVSSEAKLLEVYNYPNPVKEKTAFTFRLTQIPDELKIKVFTVAGRLIKEINILPSQLNFDFNQIAWDCKDEDGDNIANGVYLYKIIMRKDGKSDEVIQKLAIVR